MTASEDTPAIGQSADDSIDWEPIGRELLWDRLLRSSTDVKSEYGAFAGKIKAGKEPSPEQLEEMRLALRRAEEAYEMANKLVHGEPTGER